MKTAAKTAGTWAAMIAAVAIAALTGTGCETLRRGREWVRDRIGRPEQPEGDDAVPFAALRWNRGGANYSGAERDDRVTLRDVEIRGGGTPTLHYRMDGVTVWEIDRDNINHIWCVFFDETGDGTYARGGKFDWGRTNMLARPMHHVHHGYSNWDGYPARGTPWAAVVTDRTGRRRSNVVTGVWP